MVLLKNGFVITYFRLLVVKLIYWVLNNLRQCWLRKSFFLFTAWAEDKRLLIDPLFCLHIFLPSIFLFLHKHYSLLFVPPSSSRYCLICIHLIYPYLFISLSLLGLPIFTLLPLSRLWLPLIYLTFWALWSPLPWDGECSSSCYKRFHESTVTFPSGGPPVVRIPKSTRTHRLRGCASVRSQMAQVVTINLLWWENEEGGILIERGHADGMIIKPAFLFSVSCSCFYPYLISVSADFSITSNLNFHFFSPPSSLFQICLT